MALIFSAAGWQVLKRGLSWIDKWLFQPSRHLVDIAARRRARLLSMLLLPNTLHVIASAIALRVTEVGVSSETMPLILGGHAPFMFVAYALSRTRYARQSGWLYIVTSLSIPIAILFGTGPAGAASPGTSIPFLIPPVLLASVIEPVVATLLTGTVGLGGIALVTYLVGPPSWNTELRTGVMLLTFTTLLTAIFAAYRDKLEAARSAELQARNLELEALKTSLEDRVRERTAELSSRNGEMRLVFDNIAEGLFMVDGKGRLSNEHSAALVRWFGPVQDNEPFFRYFARHSAAFGAIAELAWEQLADGFLGAPTALGQMPTSLVANGRTYRFSYQLIGDGEQGSFLAFVADASNQIERENLQREKRETFALFERMLADRSGFLQFMEEHSAIVAHVLAGDLESSERSRAIHTLKGNSMLFGLESLAELCHELESHIADNRDDALLEDLAKLELRWKRLAADVDGLLGERAQVIEVSHEEHLALEQAVERATSTQDILQEIRALELEPLERRFRRCAEQVRGIAARLDKQVEVEISGGGVRLDSKRWAPLWAAFVHVLRNAVDHGIESPEHRRASGKHEVGRIALSARRDGATISIGIEDDGRGIDWEAVRRRCVTRGLPSGSQEELMAALFADGLSTADGVTDISGRGIGMSALQSAVRVLGGTISVQSERGRGARVIMSFPTLSRAAA
jgi:HPt (histidine-containing phosphotransfer) domain-containing protein